MKKILRLARGQINRITKWGGTGGREPGRIGGGRGTGGGRGKGGKREF